MDEDTLRIMRETRPEFAPRWERFVRWLEARGGRAQVSLETLSEELEIPVRSLSDIIRRMDYYRLVKRVRAVGQSFGRGAVPNVYMLGYTWDQWCSRGYEHERARIAELRDEIRRERHRDESRRQRERKKARRILERDGYPTPTARADEPAEVEEPPLEVLDDDDLAGW